MKFSGLIGIILLCAAASLPAQGEAELLTRAQRAYLSGDIQTAKANFKTVLELQPGNVTARNYLRMIAVQEAKSGVGGQLEKQVRGVQLDAVKLKDASFRDALEFLKQQAAKQSIAVSFVTQLSAEALAKPVTLDLGRVPLTEALRYLCELNGARYVIEKYAIVIKPAAEGAPAPSSPR